MSNIHIENSHTFSKRGMRELINGWRDGEIRTTSDTLFVVLNRSNFSLINEWCCHNLLYKLGIARERTKDVDLNYPQTIWEKIGYNTIGLIARIFIR